MALIGQRELTRKLRVTIPAKVEEAIKREMEKWANKIVAMMRRLVPVDKGELRDSIGWTWGDPPAGVRVFARSKPMKNGARITIYAGGKGIPQAIFQEHGTKFMPANPYFYPSYRANRKGARAGITRAGRKAIREGWAS